MATNKKSKARKSTKQGRAIKDLTAKNARVVKGGGTIFVQYKPQKEDGSLG